MEYALEGHGYAAKRILLARLAASRAETGGGGDPSLDELRGGGAGFRGKAPPGLLSTLEPLLPGGPMNGLAFRVATGAKAVFDRLGAELPLRITQCTLETGPQDGHLLVGVHCPTRTAEVRVDDEVAAGVLIALRGEARQGYRLEVKPRVFRKVCSNGLVVFSGHASGHEIDPQLLTNAEDQESLNWAIEETTRACLDQKVFAGAVERCRQSAMEWLDPDGSEFADVLDALLGSGLGETVRHRYRTEGDFTRWGLVNAMTAEARTAPGALMLELEHFGGVLADAKTAFRALAQETRRMVEHVRNWYHGPDLPDDDGPSVNLDDMDDLAERFAALHRQQKQLVT